MQISFQQRTIATQLGKRSNSSPGNRSGNQTALRDRTESFEGPKTPSAGVGGD
jgi:hypothetical protein